MHDQHAGCGRLRAQVGDRRTHFAVSGDVDAEATEEPLGLDEVALHVDDDQGGVLGRDELGQLGEHVLAVHRDQRVSSGGSCSDVALAVSSASGWSSNGSASSATKLPKAAIFSGAVER